MWVGDDSAIACQRGQCHWYLEDARRHHRPVREKRGWHGSSTKGERRVMCVDPPSKEGHPGDHPSLTVPCQWQHAREDVSYLLSSPICYEGARLNLYFNKPIKPKLNTWPELHKVESSLLLLLSCISPVHCHEPPPLFSPGIC